MNKKIFIVATVIALSMLLIGASLFAKEPPKNPDSEDQVLAKTMGARELYQILNINNLWTWVKENGESNHSPDGDNGVYYPRGLCWVIYKDGFKWGGKCYTDENFTQGAPYDQTLRMGGNDYADGTKAGWIEGFGSSANQVDPGLPLARCFRIRRDYYFMSDEELRQDAAEYLEQWGNPASVSDAQIQAIKEQYAQDWEEWPVELGAPYIERNGQEGYQPPPPFGPDFNQDSLISQNRDEPGVAGADPNSPADQVIWNVYNDLDRNIILDMEGSEPMGLEIQRTVWGYKRTDALGNIYFKKFRFINKGGVDVAGDGSTMGTFYIDSMYVAQWSDPDLGAHSEDLLGCDTSLSMGYVYNGNATDAEFNAVGEVVPAAGYDFLAGPMVSSPGDTAVFNMKYVPDHENMPMTSFSWFSAGSPISDPGSNYDGGRQWYRMYQGFMPRFPERQYYPHAPDREPTKFPYSGDPVTGTGRLDGLGTDYSFPPGDRRLLLCSGPFQMAPGDTQEVVVGFVVGQGADRFSSISVMKFNDRFCQNTYDALFRVASPPLVPSVNVAELDEKIVLDWGSDIQRVKDIETIVNEPGEFHFEGYNVYQFPSSGSNLSAATRIKTFDLADDPTVILTEGFDAKSGQILDIPIQFGSNSGIQRYIEIERDYVADKDKLYNGQEYYFAVTAYAHSKEPGFIPTALESKAQVLTCVPKKAFGTEYQRVHGDTLEVDHVSGPSDGIITPLVVDPTALTGHDYEVRFDTTGGQVTWDLFDVTENKYVLTDQTNQSGDGNYSVVDGIFLKVEGPPPGTKAVVQVSDADGPLTEDEYDGSGTPYGGNSVWHSLSSPNDPNRFYVSAGGGSGSIDRMDRSIANANSHDFELRFTDEGGYYVWWYDDDTFTEVPFEFWDIGLATPDDPSDDVRCITGGYSGGTATGAGGFTFDYTDPTFGYPATDWVYVRRPDNADGSYATFAGDLADGTVDYSPDWWGNSTEVLARITICDYGGGGTFPPTGTVIRWITNKPNGPNDVFSFTSPAPETNKTMQTASVDHINVFPNPYYAFNPAEERQINKFVTFAGLPPNQDVTIRIFNLAGQLVRKLEKNDETEFMRWDLQNFDRLPVASGMYIAHVKVKLPAGGDDHKILKFAIIQEQEILNVY